MFNHILSCQAFSVLGLQLNKKSHSFLFNQSRWCNFGRVCTTFNLMYQNNLKRINLARTSHCYHQTAVFMFQKGNRFPQWESYFYLLAAGTTLLTYSQDSLKEQLTWSSESDQSKQKTSIDKKIAMVEQENQQTETPDDLPFYSSMQNFLYTIKQCLLTDDHVQIQVNSYQLDCTPEFSEKFLLQVSSYLNPGQSVSILYNEHPMQIPVIYQITHSGYVQSDELSYDAEINLFLQMDSIAEDIFDNDIQLLWSTIKDVYRENIKTYQDQRINREQFIQKILLNLNEQIQTDYRKYDFNRLELLILKFRQQWQSIYGNVLSPIDILLSVFPTSKKIILMLGGTGQMGSAFTSMLRANGVIEECILVSTGRTLQTIAAINSGKPSPRALIGGEPINKHNEIPLHVVSSAQQEYWVKDKCPEIIFFGLKTKDLMEVFYQLLPILADNKDLKPLLVFPCKSFVLGEHGEVSPIQIVINLLKATGREDLVKNILMLGGYFLAGKIIDDARAELLNESIPYDDLALTMAASCRETINKFLPVINNNWLHIEIFGNHEQSCRMSAIAGAAKNPLTYLNSYNLMWLAIESDGIKVDLSASRDRFISENMQATRQLICCICEIDEGTLLPLPKGVLQDIKACLIEIPSLLHLVDEVKHILAAENITKSLSKLAELLKFVAADNDKCYGSRNCRDGLMDAIIYIVYNKLYKSQDWDNVLYPDFITFRNIFYPLDLFGLQEGRSGIKDLEKWAEMQSKKLPSAFIEASEIYKKGMVS